MLYPVLVNISILDEQGKENIASAVIDFHYTRVARLINTVDNNTSLLTADGIYFKVLIPFRIAYEMYHLQHRIDQRFKEEIDEYYKDNYKFIRNRNRNGETD